MPKKSVTIQLAEPALVTLPETTGDDLVPPMPNEQDWVGQTLLRRIGSSPRGPDVAFGS